MLVMIIAVFIVLTGMFIAVTVAGNRAQGRLEAKKPKPRNARSEPMGQRGKARYSNRTATRRGRH